MKRALYTAHFHADAIAATTPYMLVDLSDSTNYQHVNTNHIHIAAFHITAMPAGTSNWSIHIGTVTEVDATNGSVNWLYGIRFSQILYVDAKKDYTLGGANNEELCCTVVGGETVRYITNDVQTGDTNWQTDTGLASPVGTAGGDTGKPGAGDLVMLVTENSGTSTLSVDVTVQYYTE